MYVSISVRLRSILHFLDINFRVILKLSQRNPSTMLKVLLMFFLNIMFAGMSTIVVFQGTRVVLSRCVFCKKILYG